MVRFNLPWYWLFVNAYIKTGYASTIDGENDCRDLDPTSEYICPAVRYCPWNGFNIRTRFFLRSKLGYSQLDWDISQINPIELSKFEDLDRGTQRNLQKIGFTAKTHDCCNNHYSSYDWEDFDATKGNGIMDALSRLGYSRERWNNGDGSQFDGVSWKELPPDVQYAAYSLCYNEHTWDDESLDTWPQQTILPGQIFPSPTTIPSVSLMPTGSPSGTPSSSPTDAPSVTLSTNPTSKPTLSHSTEPTEHPVQSPSSGPSESAPPSDVPTFIPTANPTHSQSPSDAPTPYTMPPAFMTMSKQDCRTTHDDHEYYCPVKRYCLWSFYSPEMTATLQEKVGYIQPGWDYLFPSPIDQSYWSGLPESATQALRGLGYDEDKFDCCNSHYFQYDWNDFTKYEGYEMVLYALKMLGYTEEIWNSGTPVKYEDYFWHELPVEVQEAVFDGLCYTEELWNGYPLLTWSPDATLPGSYNTSLWDGYYYQS